VEILSKGVRTWNKWRRENPHTIPNLNRANLSNARLTGVNFEGVHLYEANLYEAILHQANLSRARIIDAELLAAELCNADLTEAFLTDSNLTSADFGGAILHRAILWRTKFDDTNVRGADFAGAKVGATIFGYMDLSEVKGLTAAQHRWPSILGIDTIYRSRGHIPEAFLIGAGVPNDFVTFMRSLVANPIDFYSCFISYSTKGKAFAERLHADLQGKGVRCWFAPEDLKIGDKTRLAIDESIRVYDKLLLILTEDSVASHWVEHEVETALAREQEQKRVMLFPIRLDDAVMEIKTGWPAHIKNTRHIGDFTHWKDHDAYLKSFARLLRDLKASELKKR
jgi:hypothetical protein